MRYPFNVYVDFDGTISRQDTTDLLLTSFASSEWHDVEASWERGEIGSQECLARQVDLLRLLPEAYRHWLETVPLDPAFPAFARFCERNGIAVTIVSDGLDQTIAAAMRRFGLDLPVKANRLEWQGEDRWKLSFPHARPGCTSQSGHCKCSSLTSGGYPMIMIGDGRSDFCAAERATITFAKGRLLDYCRKQGISYRAYDTFTDLLPTFTSWLYETHGQKLAMSPATMANKDLLHAN